MLEQLFGLWDMSITRVGADFGGWCISLMKCSKRQYTKAAVRRRENGAYNGLGRGAVQAPREQGVICSVPQALRVCLRLSGPAQCSQRRPGGIAP